MSVSIFLLFSLLFSIRSWPSCVSLLLFLQFSFLLLAISCLKVNSIDISSFLSASLCLSYSTSPILDVNLGIVHLLYSDLLFRIRFSFLSSWILTLSNTCLSNADLVKLITFIPNSTSLISLSLWLLAMCFIICESSSILSNAIWCSSPLS